MPCEPAVSRAESPGRSRDERGVVGADGVGVEHHDVGDRALAQHAAVAQPEQRRRRARDELHRPLERDQLATAEAVGEEARGVGRAAHAVEVGAGVGAADHRPRVVPHLAAQVPRRAVVVLRDRPQHGAQLVGDHDVEQRAEVRLAALGGDVARRRGRAAPRSPARTRRRGGSRRSRRGDGTRPPRATATSSSILSRVSGSRRRSMRSGTGTPRTSLPAGDAARSRRS